MYNYNERCQRVIQMVKGGRSMVMNDTNRKPKLAYGLIVIVDRDRYTTRRTHGPEINRSQYVPKEKK